MFNGSMLEFIMKSKNTKMFLFKITKLMTILPVKQNVTYMYEVQKLSTFHSINIYFAFLSLLLNLILSSTSGITINRPYLKIDYF